MSASFLEAGASAIDITPELPVTLAGHLARRDAVGVLSPLHARAIVVGNGQTKLVFVLLDLIAFLHDDCHEVRQGIADALQLPIENVCVSCTHTHAAPGVKSSFGTPREAAYLDWAKPRMIAAAVEADAAAVPAQAAWGNGREARPQYNRRFHMRDGSVQMNPRVRDDIVRPAGPTDPDIPFLFLRRQSDETPIAILANYSLHYIGDSGMMEVWADYFGEFSRLAKERFGDGCVALLTHGASGDINNVNHQNLPAPWYPNNLQPTEKSALIAGWLLDAAQEVWDGAQWHNEAVLAATQEIYDLRVRRPNADEVKELERQSKDESLSAIRRGYAHSRLELAGYPETLPQVVSSLRVGNWAASTLTGEIFCQFGLDLKYASPFAATALIELANGYGGYTPTEYSSALGGYETWLSQSAFAAPGSGEEMVAIAARQLHDLWLENDPEKIAQAREHSHQVIW
jgi:hypothetical protein